MNGKKLALACLLLPGAASATSFPTVFVEESLQALGIKPPPAFEVPAPPAPAAVLQAKTAAALFSEGLWNALAAPDPATLKTLAAKLPNLDVKQVRELTWAAFEPLLAHAAAHKLTVLDFFTDDGLTSPRVFHVSRTVLEEVDKAYDLNSVFLVTGATVKAEPFKMTDVVMGGKRAVMLYDRDDFTYAHPVYKSHGGKYTLASVVSEEILGPGKVAVTGLTGMLGLAVQEIRRTGPTDVEIVTALATVGSNLYPIAKRP